MTEYQSQILIERFQANPYVDKEERRQLVKLLNISEGKVMTWFLNRRKRAKASGQFKGESRLVMYIQSI